MRLPCPGQPHSPPTPSPHLPHPAPPASPALPAFPVPHHRFRRSAPATPLPAGRTVVERRGVCAVLNDHGVHGLVNLVRGDAGPHQAARVLQHLSRQTAAGAHLALALVEAIDGELGRWEVGGGEVGGGKVGRWGGGEVGRWGGGEVGRRGGGVGDGYPTTVLTPPNTTRCALLRRLPSRHSSHPGDGDHSRCGLLNDLHKRGACPIPPTWQSPGCP